MSSIKKPVVIKGKLSFKGSASKSNAKISKKVDIATSSASTSNNVSNDTPNGSQKGGIVLTDAQLRHKKRRLELETRDKKKLVDVPYRDRIEAFNAKLSTMTEHNDIPRISAAGNG